VTRRCVLAYSGGLDTSVAVRWIRETWGMAVSCVAVDVGPGDGLDDSERDAIVARALAAGAESCAVVDARQELAESCCAPALVANARYEGKYPLVSALSRPIIARHLVAEARRVGADAVAHGCTGKGNDQVRFEVSVRALAPNLEVLAPAREWGMTRADAVAYAAKWGIPVTATVEQPYSIDENLWGRAIECGEIEDPWVAPPEAPYTLTRPTAADDATFALTFERGLPVALDGEPLALAEVIERVGAITGARGYGRLDVVESRRVGIKSREVYECPGALALIEAHQDLEALTLERDVLHEKARLEPRWAELVYDGLWYSPLRQALDAFMAETQRHVAGEVRLTVSPGGALRVVGRRSPVALYDKGLATYDRGDAFRHEDAAGFVRLWGLGVTTWASRQGGAEQDGPTT